jgi:hypothetical protein
VAQEGISPPIPSSSPAGETAAVLESAQIAKGNPRPDSHPKTQSLFVHLWIDSYRMFPPWSLAADQSGVLNLPSGVDIDKVHPWTGIDGQTCWSLDALLLQSTRSQILVERAKRRRADLQAANRRVWGGKGPSARTRSTFALLQPNLTSPRREVCGPTTGGPNSS